MVGGEGAAGRAQVCMLPRSFMGRRLPHARVCARHPWALILPLVGRKTERSQLQIMAQSRDPGSCWCSWGHGPGSGAQSYRHEGGSEWA